MISPLISDLNYRLQRLRLRRMPAGGLQLRPCNSLTSCPDPKQASVFVQSSALCRWGVQVLRGSARLLMLSLLLLYGCGGGGGGGGDTASKPLEYSGKTSAVVITPADATYISAQVLDAETLAEALPSGDLINGSASLRALTLVARAAKAVINDTEPCFPEGATRPSGQVSYSGTLDEQLGTGLVSIHFQACQDGDSFIDGRMTLRIDEAILTADFWQPLDSIFSFDAIRVRDPLLNVEFGGTMRDQRHLDGSQTLTLNMVLKDHSSNLMRMSENLVISTAFGQDYFLSESISGRIYASELGYLDIATPVPLHFEAFDSLYPSSGRLRITGAEGRRLRMTALSSERVLIELDLEPDVGFEVSGALDWITVAAAGSDPADLDGDGMEDGWEAIHGLSGSNFADASEDADQDALRNDQEFRIGTDPTDQDTEDDGMPDGWELGFGFDPLTPADAALDADGDLATNLEEYLYDTDPTNGSSTPADLAVTMVVSSAEVAANTLYQYAFSISNLGPGIAREVSFTGAMPSGAQIYSVVPGVISAPWDCSAATESLSCTPFIPFSGQMDPGEQVTIEVPVIAPPAAGMIRSTATISSSTLDFGADNNSALLDSTVNPPLLTQIDRVADGENGVDGLERPFRLAISPDGLHLYVAGIVDDALAIFSRDPLAGTLSFVAAHRAGLDTPEQPDFPKAVAVSPDGKQVYVTTEWDSLLLVFARDATTGVLSLLEKHQDGVAGVEGLARAIAVTVSSDGLNVYVAGPDDNAIAVFNRNLSTGALSFVTQVVDDTAGVDGLRGAFDLALSPDGTYLYVAGSLDDAVAIFQRDGSGLLSYLGLVGNVLNPQSLTISPDGSHLYALGGDASLATRGISLLVRDPFTGLLTPTANYANGTNGIVGLEGMYGLTLSPDGRYLYVAATTDSSLGVFARDPDSGALRFIEVHKDSIGGAEGLDSSWAVVVSPDSRFVYVSAGGDNALSGFEVDSGAVP